MASDEEEEEINEATSKMGADSSTIDFDISWSIAKIRILMCKLRLSGVLLDYVFKDDESLDNTEDMANEVDFQMACNLPVTDSMSMLAEQQSQGSQDEGGSQPSQVKWECPVLTCGKTYAYEKHLKNHLKKIHESDDMLDDTFTPRESSTYENAVDLVDNEEGEVSRKRKKPEDEDDDLEEVMGRARLSSIKEEDEDLVIGVESMDRMLEDSVPLSQAEKSTQEVRSAVAEAFRKAESVAVDVGSEHDEDEDGMDDSLNREEEKKIGSLEVKLKTKSDLVNIMNAKLAENEAELGELKEVRDQLDKAVAKLTKDKESLTIRLGDLAKEKEALRVAAKKEIEEKERSIKELKKKVGEMRPRGESPDKAALKADVEKLTAKMIQQTNRIANLQKDLKLAQKGGRKAVVEQETHDKVKTALDAALIEMEEVKRELDRYKREMAKAYRRIPCGKDNCNSPKDCEYSHQLRYEDRSAPKAEDWRKKVPCRFENFPNGCRKSAEDCVFLHVGGARRDDLRENITGRGRRESEGQNEDQGLNVSVEVIGQRAGERRVERTGRGEPAKNRYQPAKRMRFGNNNEEVEKDNEMSGNARGAAGPPPTSAPSRNLRRSLTPLSGNSGRRARSRSSARSSNPPTQREERSRRWSPVTSPENNWGSRGRQERPNNWQRSGGQEQRSRGWSVDNRRRDISRGRRDNRADNFQSRRNIDPWI